MPKDGQDDRLSVYLTPAESKALDAYCKRTLANKSLVARTAIGDFLRSRRVKTVDNPFPKSPPDEAEVA